jgi:hypothetical protein
LLWEQTLMSDETKFTTGPWHSGMRTIEGRKIGDHHVSAAGYCIAVVDSNAANAHLIATAPELYEVLDAAVICFRQRDQQPHEVKLVQWAKLVLSKARGES